MRYRYTPYPIIINLPGWSKVLKAEHLSPYDGPKADGSRRVVIEATEAAAAAAAPHHYIPRDNKQLQQEGDSENFKVDGKLVEFVAC